jgi:hypothetical protein
VHSGLEPLSGLLLSRLNNDLVQDCAEALQEHEEVVFWRSENLDQTLFTKSTHQVQAGSCLLFCLQIDQSYSRGFSALYGQGIYRSRKHQGQFFPVKAFALAILIQRD